MAQVMSTEADAGTAWYGTLSELWRPVQVQALFVPGGAPDIRVPHAL